MGKIVSNPRNVWIQDSSEISCRAGIPDPESLIYVLDIGKGGIGRVA